jgi:SAM-dependent methyltransferase
MLNSWDPIWEEIFINQEWGKYPGESLIQFIARNFYKSDRKKVRLLEIGCGTGANIWFMSREGFNVYGIDGSVKAVEIAQKRLEKELLKAELISGDIINMCYEHDSFDGIIDVECLCCNNIDNTRSILQNIYNVLKDGGLFYSRTFSDEMYIGEGYKALSKDEYTDIKDGPLRNKGFIRLIDKSAINELYGQFFKVLSIDEMFYTSNNGQIKISEWIIICQKAGTQF